MSHGEREDRYPDGDEGWQEGRIPLDLGQPVELTVHNPNGEVRVRATERDNALVRHVKRGRPGSRAYDEASLRIDAHNNRIEVRPDPPGDVGWAGVSVSLNVNPFKRGAARAEARGSEVHIGSASGEVAYDLDVELPRSARIGRIEVKTASGGVAVEDLAGPIHLASASGDIRASDTRGDLTLHSVSGDQLVEGSTGRLTVRAASGDVRIVRAALERFTLQSVSGDLDLDAALTGDGPYRLESVSGDVRLGLAAPAATVTFRSVSGDDDFALPFRKIDRRTWRAGESEGGPQIAVKTVSGDLHAEISTQDRPPAAAAPSARTGSPATPEAGAVVATPPVVTMPEPPAAPEPPVAPAPPPAVEMGTSAEEDNGAGQEPLPAADAGRLAVLEAVERGEIDVEEALRRLDAATAAQET